MELRNLEEKNQIDAFIQQQPFRPGSFLQSFNWGEFQKQYGYKIWRLGVFDREKLKSVALILKHPLPLGKSYLYCPRGPIIDEKSETLKFLQERIKEIAGKEKAVFFRFEPTGQFSNSNFQISISGSNTKILQVEPVQPQNNWILNLNQPEEKILAAMKQKTRYNIRLAQKKGVKVVTSDDSKYVDRFFALAQETAERNEIKTHPKSYYQKMMEVLAQQKIVKFYLAEYNQKVIAVDLMLYFGNTVTYLHGGSASEDRNVMAPYLLHWRAIQDAKQQGIHYYDFGGVSPKNEPNHNWAGISRFKRGFGGYQLESAGAFDLVFTPGWYAVYQVAKIVKKRM